MKLDLQSERFAPTGNLSGAGIKKCLGAPTLNKLRILIREACQNAWDARTGDGAVVFRIHLRRLTKRQHSALCEAMYSRPKSGDTRTTLDKSLGGEPIWVLEISDHGTRGLAGPVRADTDGEVEHADFVNFFRNIGSPRDQRFGGGTYGYGKSSLYNLSHCRTILTYSQTTDGHMPSTRFMAGAIGHPYRDDGIQFTGRHWWGSKGNYQRIVDPLLKDPAHRLAQSLGLDRRGTEDTGTSILVLDPDIGQRTALQTANSISECLAWFFWPKMLPRADGQSPMKFELLLDGETVRVPAPENTPPLQILVDAMEALRTRGSSGFHRLRCERPGMDLGTLGLAKGPRRARVRLDTGEDEPLIPDHCSHVALMRPAELVVKYIERPALPSDLVEFGGVFICDEEVEEHFADSEPPAHDDWLPASLPDPAKRFVGVALRRIKEATDHFANPAAGTGTRPEQTSLAKVADLLGSVLIGQDGGALGKAEQPPRPTGKGKSGAPKVLRISEPESFRLAMVKRVPCALFQVQIDIPEGTLLQLHADPLVVMVGGSTVPAEAGGPRVVAWLDASGTPLNEGPDVTFSEPGEWHPLIAVSVTPDCAVSVAVRPQSDSP